MNGSRIWQHSKIQIHISGIQNKKMQIATIAVSPFPAAQVTKNTNTLVTLPQLGKIVSHHYRGRNVLGALARFLTT